MIPILLTLLQAAEAAPKPIESLPPLVQDAQAISPDHNRIAISTRDEGVWVVDIATKTMVFRVPPTSSVVEAVAWSSDAATLGLLHRDAFIEIVDAGTGRVRATGLSVPSERVRRGNRSLTFAAADSVLIVALNGPTTDLFNTTSGGLIARLASYDESIRSEATALALTRDGERFALGNKSNQISIWLSRTGEALPMSCTIPSGRGWPGIHALAFDSQGKQLAIGASDCNVRVWQVGSKQLPRILSHCDADIFGDLAISDVEFSDDGSRLVSMSFPWWEARVWDLTSGAVATRYEYGGGGPSTMHVWFAREAQAIVTELGGRLAPVHLDPSAAGSALPVPRPIPGGIPTAAEWARFRHEGDYAWAVVDHHLVVRKVPDEEPVMKIKVREK